VKVDKLKFNKDQMDIADKDEAARKAVVGQFKKELDALQKGLKENMSLDAMKKLAKE
jgi:hypothetical protein